jgi:hypothetical protein
LAKGLLLHHDNARSHAAQAAQERIQELQWELLEHPPDSPDLAPSDFHLSDPLRDDLDGTSFVEDEGWNGVAEVAETTNKRLMCCAVLCCAVLCSAVHRALMDW